MNQNDEIVHAFNKSFKKNPQKGDFYVGNIFLLANKNAVKRYFIVDWKRQHMK
jgi:hypothetical protein